MTTEKTKKPSEKKVAPSADVADYEKGLAPHYIEVCRKLRAEIKAMLPNAEAKIWHAIPVWFINGNPVVGYSLTAKNGINLLFWNGQALNEPELKPAGKFMAAQVQFQNKIEIKPTALRRWLKKAGKNIWDYPGRKS